MGTWPQVAVWFRKVPDDGRIVWDRSSPPPPPISRGTDKGRLQITIGGTARRRACFD